MFPSRSTHTAELLAQLDEVFESGFGRLSSANLQMLASLASSFAGTPLAEPLQAAIAGLGRSEFVDRALRRDRGRAGGRARGDARRAGGPGLRGAGTAAAGARGVRGHAGAGGPAAGGGAARERAPVVDGAGDRRGFGNLEVGALLPFQATLDAIMAEPALVRHAALLSGFLDELLTVFPAHGKPGGAAAAGGSIWGRGRWCCRWPRRRRRPRARSRASCGCSPPTCGSTITWCAWSPSARCTRRASRAGGADQRVGVQGRRCRARRPRGAAQRGRRQAARGDRGRGGVEDRGHAAARDRRPGVAGVARGGAAGEVEAGRRGSRGVDGTDSAAAERAA